MKLITNINSLRLFQPQRSHSKVLKLPDVVPLITLQNVGSASPSAIGYQKSREGGKKKKCVSSFCCEWNETATIVLWLLGTCLRCLPGELPLLLRREIVFLSAQCWSREVAEGSLRPDGPWPESLCWMSAAGCGKRSACQCITVAHGFKSVLKTKWLVKKEVVGCLVKSCQISKHASLLSKTWKGVDFKQMLQPNLHILEDKIMIIMIR